MRMLKALHRWSSIVFGAFLLVLAGSGIWIQFEPNRLDTVLPGRMDDSAVLQSFSKRLSDFHTMRPNEMITSFGMNISGEQPFVSFNAAPINKVSSANQIRPMSTVLSLRTGQPMPPESVLHGALLRLHNSFFIGTIGRFIAIGAGLTLLYLCGSGSYFYIDLFIRRASRGRRSLFWATRAPMPFATSGSESSSALPGWMRDIHRWITTVFVVFLSVIAATGLLMQTGPTGLQLWPIAHSGAAPGLPTSISGGFTDEQLLKLLTQSIGNARKTDQAPEKLFMIDLNGGGDEARLALTYSSYQEGMYSRLYKAQSGREYPQPKSSFFFLLRLHRGDLFHEPGVWINIASGAALILLGISGLMVYLNMRRRRMQLSRKGLFWL